MALQIVVEALVANTAYKFWLGKQKPDVKDRGETIKLIVQKT